MLCTNFINYVMSFELQMVIHIIYIYIYICRRKISSRVAECTRLILLKDGFGGDLGALDRCVDECRKDTRILEWFGPPERNTLRPLRSCIDCVRLNGT
jgi:hypothetical protein